MENRENDFLQKLIQIVNESAPTDTDLGAAWEKTAEEETPAAAVETPAAAAPAASAAAAVAAASAPAESGTQKVADVGEMSIEDIMQHPAFLQGVSDALMRCGPDLQAAIERAVLPE